MKKLSIYLYFLIVCFFNLLAAANYRNHDLTIVAWLTLDSLEQRGGSALTLQYGYQFDGLIYAESAERRWMAGSDRRSRSQNQAEQLNNFQEDAAKNELIKMVAVHKDNSVSIYRNNKLYCSYTTVPGAVRDCKSVIDGDGYIAVIGLRHIGASSGEPLSGTIEDVRIYSKALSLEEIVSLTPNKASDVDPIAWWDFEGDKVVDKKWRFPYSGMSDGIYIKNGQLHLDGKGYFVAASSEEDVDLAIHSDTPKAPLPSYVPETPVWPKEPPSDWLSFHLAHPGPGIARPADPNPAYYYQGRYHLHYIYRNYTGYCFAHVSSTDMVHWRWHPTTLTPRRTGHGMYSGTGFFTKDNIPAMIYHGQGSGQNWIAYAKDQLLNEWSSPVAVEPFYDSGEKANIRNWDPDLFIRNDRYYVYSGGKNPQLMVSDDLEKWQYLGDLLHPEYSDSEIKVAKDEDISCGNMFKIGNKWMLLCISHDIGCRYYLGDFKGEKYLPETHNLMSFGNNSFFAPESFVTKDGRRVMWAWIISGGVDGRFRNLPISPMGVQSLPRELELPQDGILRIRPLEELKKLRYRPVIHSQFIVHKDNHKIIDAVEGDALEIEIEFEHQLPQTCGVELLGCNEDNHGVKIVAGDKRDNILIGDMEVPFKLNGNENLNLRIFIDKNLIEVFINERQAAVYAHPEIHKNQNIRLFSVDKDLSVRVLKIWKIKSIYSDF